MKRREIYSDLHCLPPVIVRVDGRNFRNALSRIGLEKPYDKRFASEMADAIELFFKKSGLGPDFAYTFSDEISFLFRNISFSGRIEKIDSVIPSFMSSALTITLGVDEPISFDSRVIPVNEQNITEYLIWRQDEAWRNCINSYAYYTLLSEGMKEKKAAAILKNKDSSQMHELLFQKDINISKVPTWQKRGIIIQKQEYQADGFNPHLGEETTSIRKKVVQNWNIPLFRSPDGEKFIGSIDG